VSIKRGGGRGERRTKGECKERGKGEGEGRSEKRKAENAGRIRRGVMLY